MNKLLIISTLITLLLIPGHIHIYGSGPGDDEDQPITEELQDGWVYGYIQYLHDILKPNEYFMLLKDYPTNTEQGVPQVVGGYATTDVYVKVRLRGVDVPRALQSAPPRHRPHEWLKRERYRWDDSMKYVWNIIQPHRTFRVGNFKVLEKDELLEADIEFYLGGQWHNLALAMLNDERARPPDSDWDWGSPLGSLVNPNLPE